MDGFLVAQGEHLRHAEADEAAARRGERWRSGNPRLLCAVLRWTRAKLAPRLWRKYRDALSRGDADVIAATAVERAWERREIFDSRKGSLKSWLWTIADRLTLDEIRSSWRKLRGRAMEANQAWQQAVPDPHPECDSEDANGADSFDFRPELLPAMTECLSPSEQAVLLADARSREGVAPADELAEALGISESNVYVLRHRAQKQLGPELERRGLCPKRCKTIDASDVSGGTGGGVNAHAPTPSLPRR